jgi:hypothetical protein
MTEAPAARPRSTAPRIAKTGASNKPASRLPIPLPDQALLDPQPDPSCEFKASPTDPKTDEAVRMKLDYERQCHRHAEIIVRSRLQQLQVSIGATIKAVKLREQSSR